MKVYSVHLPVYSSVTVYVEAENEEQAEELAKFQARLSDAEPIDFDIYTNSDVLEITEGEDIGPDNTIWTSKNKHRLSK
jgi:uncharacterized protein YpmB